MTMTEQQELVAPTPIMLGKYELHEITQHYHDLMPQEYDDMRADILMHGQREPIRLWRGKVVDGRNRLKICLELKREPWVKDVSKRFKTEAEMSAYVRSLNEHRRANTVPMSNDEKHARVQAQLIANAERSNREIAAEAGVSHPTVGEVRTELVNNGKIFQSNDRGDKRARILAEIAANPDQKNVDIARKTQTTPAYVSRLRNHPPEREPQAEDSQIARVKALLRAEPSLMAKEVAARLGLKAGYVHAIMSDHNRRSGRDGRSIRKNFRAFNKAIEIIFNTCEHLAEVPIPPLSNEQRKHALHRVGETISTVKSLLARIKEESRA
jgi:hypothetical protein